MIRALLTMALVITASSILAACTHTPAEDTQNQTAPPVQTAPPDAMPDGSLEVTDPSPLVEGTSPLDVLEITMDTGEFFFAPNVITAKPGQTVNITLTNTNGAMPHDFVLDELDVASDQIEMGEETMITFTVPTTAAGEEYEFYCSVGQHRANGMVGTLTVTE